MSKVLLIFAASSAIWASYASAQESKANPPSRPTAQPDRDKDEAAIKAVVDAFVKAFNAGDAEAAAATYAKSAIVVDEHGERTVGRDAIREQYAASFADNLASTIAIEADELRFLGAETAIEVGRTTITPAKGAGAPEITRFTAVYVKEDGAWKQGAVRDELAHDIPPHERLKDLEWLLGDWVNESDDAIVATSCVWAKGGAFIDREFTMKTKGMPVLSGTQRIGWDPLKRQFKTWIFDSEGGHGEGYLTRNGNEWVIKVEGVNRNGQPMTATNVITRLSKDRMSWRSTDRTVGGSAVPGIDEFFVVRKPPEAGK